MQSSWDVIVVGGGAAGLWAAGTAAARGRRTLVVEKNRKAGVKILISGGTRCNLTQHCDARAIAHAFGGHQGKFLHSPLSRLAPADVIATVQALGVPTKVEQTGKVFPCSDRALDVRDALVRRLLTAGGRLQTGLAVQGIALEPTRGTFRVALDGDVLESNHVIIATGGLSYPGCGTTGDGYAWVRALGHHVVPPRPALTPLRSNSRWVTNLQGTTLPDAIVGAVGSMAPGRRERSRLVSRNGLLFTHFGLSGPAPLNVSRVFCDADYHANAVRLDLLPGISTEELVGRLSAGSTSGGTKVAAVLREFLPRRVVDAMLALAAIEANCPVAELGRSAANRLAAAVKSNVVPIDGTLGYHKAEVTAGGVDLREVDSRTMQSRLVVGLYLVGEILDLDGPIGGYNFQAAFSTGHVAGLHA